MKIFISHTINDKDSYIELINSLREQGHTVFSIYDIKMGENWVEKIKKALNESDILILIITENYLDSSWARTEVSSAIFDTTIRILPVVVGDLFLPDYLRRFVYIKVKTKEEITAAVLWGIARLDNVDDNNTLFKKRAVTHSEEDNIEEKIGILKEALIDNQLTLVCGAGVSRDSAIPTWNELLVNILNDVYLSDQNLNADSKVTAETLLSLMPQSNLILGKYLKIILKDDFDRIVQKHLYSNYNQEREFEQSNIVQGHEEINYALETSMMKAIVELSRPKRRGNRLESIITFNFDDLIECALLKHHIEHCSIWKEGQIYGINDLPIFHVHGFLPNLKVVDTPNLVFSEEAYHSQFIDPYSWANLVQLNTFSTNICLFVGLSLSDPNLRRLLDISWRRNQRCKHYIIMKKTPQKNRTSEIVNMLFEQDANSLGLNVIWCNDYSEIPNILFSIAK